MKLIFIKLILSILLLNIVLSTHIRSKSRSKQLFEMVEKQITSQKKGTNENQPKLNSLFSSTEESQLQNEIRSQEKKKLKVIARIQYQNLLLARKAKRKQL